MKGSNKLEQLMNSENLTAGNSTGRLTKSKLARMKAMADLGETVQSKIDKSIIDSLDDPEKALKAVEIVLKYTCPVPKESADQKEGSVLNQALLERLVSLQEENRNLVKALSHK